MSKEPCRLRYGGERDAKRLHDKSRTTSHPADWFPKFEMNIYAPISSLPRRAHDQTLRPFDPYYPNVAKTLLSSRAGATFGRLAASCAAIVHLARSLCVVTSIFDRRSITVIGVDTSKLASLDCSHSLDVYIAFALFGAVTTRAVQFAVVVDVEVLAPVSDGTQGRNFECGIGRN